MKKKFFPLISKGLIICMISVVVNISFLKIHVKSKELYKENENLLQEILKNNSNVFGRILKNPEKYEVQILYTQIDRDKNNIPKFTSFKYNVDKNQYFYPASSVKLSACVLALEKLNKLGIDKSAPMRIEKSRPSQKVAYKDYSSKDKLPSIENYIKKVLVASDNEGFDRLYEFLGQEYYNETLWKKGYKDTLILHRLANPMSYYENKYTNPIKFYNKAKVIYEQPMQCNKKTYSKKLLNVKKGKGYVRGGKYINTPMDFSKSNYFSIECLQGILKAIVFPEQVEKIGRFDLKKDDYEFLKKYMKMLPKECDNPKYNFKDSHCKYFIFGDSNKPIPKNINIYNKIGCAYGYLIDNAYIIDKDKNIEFLLTAVIYANENNILNDGKYEYGKVGMPFLSNLGKEIYKYEESRRKI